MAGSGERVGTVLQTAVDVEFDAVRALLTEMDVHEHRAGSLFYTGTVAGTDVRVGLAQSGVGNFAATRCIERIVDYFDPQTVLLVGIAGAVHRDLVIGDTIVATRIDKYQGGREEGDEFLARPECWPADYQLLERARHLARTDWWRSLPTRSGGVSFRLEFRPVASGDVVLDSRSGPMARLLRRAYNDVAAIEMESAGAAEAAHANSGLSLLTIRGISDLADGSKQATDDSGSRKRAASHAAAFATALALYLAGTQTAFESPEPEPEPEPEVRRATGHVRVVVISAREDLQHFRAFRDRAVEYEHKGVDLIESHSPGGADVSSASVVVVLVTPALIECDRCIGILERLKRERSANLPEILPIWVRPIARRPEILNKSSLVPESPIMNGDAVDEAGWRAAVDRFGQLLQRFL